MTTITILRNTLKLNAEVIALSQYAALEAKLEAATWKAQGEIGFFVAACKDMAKAKAKLAKQVALQKRTKVEIAAIYRNERIARKYLKVFGQLPTKQLMTSVEQEAMLDRLLAERHAQDEAVFGVSLAA